MNKQMFCAYGDNVMIEKISETGNTAKGKVLHSNTHDLKYGDIVLYQAAEWNEINLNEDTIVDIIWRPKIRCILKEIEESKIKPNTVEYH